MKLKLWAFNQNRTERQKLPCIIIVVAPTANEANRIAQENDVSFDIEKEPYQENETFYRWEPVEEADGIIDTLIINEIQHQRKTVNIEKVNGHIHSWAIKYTESSHS